MVRPRYDASTLAGVLKVVQDARKDNQDHYVQLRDLRFTVVNDLPAALHEQLGLACADAKAPGRLSIDAEVWPRVHRFLGLPRGFGDRLPASMVVNNLNYLLASRADEMALLRVRPQGERAILRGILPPAHVRIDDLQIVRQLARMPGTGDLKPVNISVREDHFHLRLIMPRESNVGRGRDRDPVYPGLDIYNSETGAGRLAIGHCLFRMVCRNGMLFHQDIGDKRRWRHDRADGEVLRQQLAEELRLSVAGIADLVKRYRALHAVPLQGPAEVLAEFMRTHKLGSPQGRTGERILLEMGRTGDLFGQSVFDFVQAVTLVARTLDVEKRRKFEAAAGQLVMGRQ
jgi:hypothetical protein